MLVPFTVNGIALREAFFVSFLGKLQRRADPAFATGFLFFLLSLVAGLCPARCCCSSAVCRRADGKDIGAQTRT